MTQTFVAGLRCEGLSAPFVVNEPMNRAIFDVYVETQLAPSLKPGDVVILDNLPAHKSPKAEQALGRPCLFQQSHVVPFDRRNETSRSRRRPAVRDDAGSGRKAGNDQ